MQTPLLIALLTGCNLLGTTQVKYWGGWSEEFHVDGTQDGQASELLIRQDYQAREHKIVEERWRFDDEDGLVTERWEFDLRGNLIDTRFNDGTGDVAITGDMLAGAPYDWTEWHMVWTWLNGTNGGNYLVIDGEIGTDDSGEWLHIERAHFLINDVPDGTRVEDLLFHSEEEWLATLDELGG